MESDAVKTTKTSRGPSLPTPAWIAVALLAATLVAGVACSRQDREGQAATASINTGADDYFDRDASTLGQVEVEVRLHERSIEMAPSLPQGRVTFVVVNESDSAHGFAVEGRGQHAALDHPLARGETGTLAVDLEPGTYSVYLPEGGAAHGGEAEAEGGHGERGVSRWLQVVH